MKWIFFLFVLSLNIQAQNIVVDKIEPPNWWTGMKTNEIQLLVYGEDLHNTTASFNDQSIEVKDVNVSENGHYAFIDVTIDENALPAKYSLTFTKNKSKGIKTRSLPLKLSYDILQRANNPDHHKGFSNEDIFYLLFPDRFANGDLSNDNIGIRKDDYDPANEHKRNGGDLQGVIDHLDYLESLGITAIWMNPLLENKGKGSYHGYAITDLYNIDNRFGTNDLYKRLVEEAHKRGIKIVLDHIANHIGVEHDWLSDYPTPTWINGTIENHLSDKHHMLSIADPYADPEAQKQLKSFWFVDGMPDLNQTDPYLAKYLIQNTIWWIEYSGLDGIREDTYPYPDQKFMSDWAEAIFNEYPNFNIVGETWSTRPSFLSHFQKGSVFGKELNTNLSSMMDFPYNISLRNFLTGNGSLKDVYELLSQDFLYNDPSELMVFLENHDMARPMFISESDWKRVSLCYNILLTNRGIFQMLYGSEIGMVGGDSHVLLREQFPGGFPGYKRNAFNLDELNKQEKAHWLNMQKAISIRKKYKAISSGKMIHYPPSWYHDVYAYFRFDETNKFLILANGKDKQCEYHLEDLQNQLVGYSKLVDMYGENHLSIEGLEHIDLAPLEFKLYKLEK